MEDLFCFDAGVLRFADDDGDVEGGSGFGRGEGWRAAISFRIDCTCWAAGQDVGRLYYCPEDSIMAAFATTQYQVHRDEIEVEVEPANHVLRIKVVGAADV